MGSVLWVVNCVRKERKQSVSMRTGDGYGQYGDMPYEGGLWLDDTRNTHVQKRYMHRSQAMNPLSLFNLAWTQTPSVMRLCWCDHSHVTQSSAKQAQVVTGVVMYIQWCKNQRFLRIEAVHFICKKIQMQCTTCEVALTVSNFHSSVYLSPYTRN
jgi:hypothetical protein